MATNQLHEAYDMTFGSPEHSGHPDPKALFDAERRDTYIADYLTNLESLGQNREAPTDPDINNDLAYAMLKREAPIEDRRMHAGRALDAAKQKFFERAPSIGMDMHSVYTKSEALSSEFVDAVVATAGSYPDKPDITQLKSKLSGVAGGEQSPEKTAVAVMAMFNVLQPYIIDRMLELNVYDPKELRAQVAEMQHDSALVLRFYRSTAGVAKSALTGKNNMSTGEMADKLFNIGPIFVQLGQTFSNAASQPGTDNETKEFLHNIGSAMQEGVAMPSPKQQAKLEKSLPEGLKMEDALSSAKMAYVFSTSSPEGKYATKIKRPGIEKAATENVRMFNLMAHIVTRYIETHAGNTKMAKNLPLVKDSLPFGLALIEADIMSELDFVEEARTQVRAAQVLERHEGIIVPKVVDEYSNDGHITMEHVAGKRIKDVPANPDYIKNALVLLLRGRRKNALFHGDMHGGNIKAAVDAKPGTLVAYDWGGSFEMPRHFEAKLLPFILGVMRKNPKAIAKAYRKIQSPNFHQATQAEALQAATDAIAKAKDKPYATDDEKKLTRLEKLSKETTSILTTYIGLLGKDYQSTLDARYVRYIRSNKALISVIKQELAKPAYDTARHGKILTKSAAKAVKEVYLMQKKKNKNT